MATKVPKAVQDQLDRANELEEQRKTSGPGPAPVVDSTPAATPPAEPPIIPPPGAAGISDPTGDDPQGKGADDYKQRALVAEGRVRAIAEEAARNKEAIQGYQTRENELKQEIADVNQRLSESQAAGRASEIDLLIGEMSEDPERAAEAEMLKSLHQQVQTQGRVINELQGARQVQVHSAGDQFWAALREQVPDLHQINADPAFNVWANSADEYLAKMTGETRTRQQLLEQAVRDVAPHNVDQCVQRVVSIYSQYKKSSQPASQTFSPEHSAGGEPLEPKQGLQWTTASVQKFYADARRKLYSEEEYTRLEADLNRAGSEGRFTK